MCMGENEGESGVIVGGDDGRARKIVGEGEG